MKIMITGALGHIGSALLANEQYKDAILVDNLATQRYITLFLLPSQQFYEVDITQPLDHLPRPDVVIHLAGIINATQIEKDPDLAYTINSTGAEWVARQCADWDAKMILTSTTSVYQGVEDEQTEESNIRPYNHYAISKLMAEERCAEVLPSEQLAILRFGTIFGQSIGMRFDTAVQKFCWRAFVKKPIEIWQDSIDQVRPYLGIDDCVQAIGLVIDRGLSGIYNVVTNHYTPQDIVAEIEKLCSVETKLVKQPIIAQQSYEINCAKLRAEGFRPRNYLDVEIKSILKLLGMPI